MNDSENHDSPRTPAEFSRYSRQILCRQIGIAGQARLSESSVLLLGCGALGSVLAETLVRAGVGRLKLCDRDFVETDNLQRQVLFDEGDVAGNLPKATAAAARLARINSQVNVEAIVADANHGNIERLAEGAVLLLDGTDNFETRYLINDLAVKTDRPWVYGAVIGTTGLCMTVIPHETPCLRCVFEEAPPADMNPTCDTAGVLAPVVNVIASLQAMEAIKLLIGRADQINRGLMQFDGWSGRLINVNVAGARRAGECPCCGKGDFAYLSGRRAGGTTTLCGRNAVQVLPGNRAMIDFAAIAARLRPLAGVALSYNAFLLRAEVNGHEMTLFPDGRAIVKGTKDADQARSLYAKYFGC